MGIPLEIPKKTIWIRFDWRTTTAHEAIFKTFVVYQFEYIYFQIFIVSKQQQNKQQTMSVCIVRRRESAKLQTKQSDR